MKKHIYFYRPPAKRGQPASRLFRDADGCIIEMAEGLDEAGRYTLTPYGRKTAFIVLEIYPHTQGGSAVERIGDQHKPNTAMIFECGKTPRKRKAKSVDAK